MRVRPPVGQCFDVEPVGGVHVVGVRSLARLADLSRSHVLTEDGVDVGRHPSARREGDALGRSDLLECGQLQIAQLFPGVDPNGRVLRDLFLF
jgi:hypothetical protein